jgi:hypothetical protein
MKTHANARLSLKGRELLIGRVENAGWSDRAQVDRQVSGRRSWWVAGSLLGTGPCREPHRRPQG